MGTRDSRSSEEEEPAHSSKQLSQRFLPGVEGAAAALIRQIDWSRTPLGSPGQWPRSLVSLVSMMLHSRHPMFLWWGPELVQFYNDAYLPSFGEGKHPRAMGQRGRDCWPEIWSIIAPQIEDVMLRAKASWNEDALVPIDRNGRIEEVYWTYGYSPAFDDEGRVAGTLVVCTETTQRVLSARRAELVRRVNEGLAVCAESAEVLPAVEALFAQPNVDVAFFEVRAAPAGGRPGRSERLIDLPEPRAAASWPEPVTQALSITCRAPAATLVFGISPRLSLDANYREFLEQIVDQVEHAHARIQAFRVRALAEAERRNLLMQAPIATALLTGPRHVYELTNPLYQQLIGGQEVLGKPYVEAFPEAAGNEVEHILDRVYQTGEPYLAEEYLVPATRLGPGSTDPVYLRFNVEAVRDTDAQIYGVLVIGLDITAEVRARQVIEKSVVEQDRMVTQLEAAARAKDEFLATVSHELRTPLTAILGWARLLNEGGDLARIKKGLSVIERNAKAQAQLIEDILDVSRIVSGKVRLNMCKLEPSAVIRAAVETVRPLAGAKHQQLEIVLADALPSITADEDRLQQVVWNLLSNAVKFTPDGGAIQVRATSAADCITITVSDNGRGISQEFLPHVFDRFRQDDTSTTKQHAGLGLGLAIARHLVELHGGSVMVESGGLGHGAAFSVSLPLRAVTPPTPLPTEEVERGHRTPVPGEQRLSGVRLLVVDDQDDARELLATVLEDAGASVVQATSVQAALAALAASAVSVIISDIGMPEEDGYGFIQRLRSRSTPERDVPAVAVTAFARAEDRLLALKSGFNEHIAKPIDPQALVEVVERLHQSRLTVGLDELPSTTPSER